LKLFVHFFSGRKGVSQKGGKNTRAYTFLRFGGRVKKGKFSKEKKMEDLLKEGRLKSPEKIDRRAKATVTGPKPSPKKKCA